jgi:hypothetical protein
MKLSNRLLWNIKKGDLVKLKDYPGGREDHYIYIRGVVISEIRHDEDQQIPMWPSVDVYIFRTGAVRNCMPGSLEIISNS